MQNDIHLDAHGLSRRGRAHERNHDHFAIADLNRSVRVQQSNLALEDDSRVVGRTQGHVYVVADGISSGPAPAVASSTAIDSLVHAFLDELPWARIIDGSPREVTRALDDAFRSAEEDLARRGAASGMGTTMTLAFVAWPDLHIAHVGDSRAYVQRGGELRQLTTDHTLSQVRTELGVEPNRGDEHVLWNAVGGPTQSDVQPEVLHFELQPEDVLLLCSDGAATAGVAGELAAVLRSGACAREMAARIVDRDDRDDRTAIVVRCTPRGESAVPATVPAPAPSLTTERTRPRRTLTA